MSKRFFRRESTIEIISKLWIYNWIVWWNYVKTNINNLNIFGEKSLNDYQRELNEDLKYEFKINKNIKILKITIHLFIKWKQNNWKRKLYVKANV